MIQKTAKIFVAGHRGLVGSAIVRKLREQGFDRLILKTRTELNLTNQQAVQDFFAAERPEYVFMAAAKVGGIYANNTFPAEFIYENLMVQTNVIDASYRSNVKKVAFLGSSCIYPKMAPQPMKESYLLSGPLEPTNEPYAVAKIAGIIQCQSYRRQYNFNAISLMPTNLFGPGDNFDYQNSHVLPALLRKFHDAHVQGNPSVSVWGTGRALREFLHVDDLADASVFLMGHYDDGEIVNVGSGEEVSIKTLAEMIQKVVGYRGEISWDSTKPDGTPRKLMDCTKIHKMGWKPTHTLESGLKSTYEWFLKHQDTLATKSR